MQRLEVSGAVLLIYRSLGVKGLNPDPALSGMLFEEPIATERVKT
jgi:hypothetical protein